MSAVKNKVTFCALNVLAALFFSSVLANTAFAHGGEDHGDSKPTTVSTDKGIVTQTAKTGDFEILFKHAALEPDQPTLGRLFITRFATNEPVTNIAPAIEIIAPDGKAFQAEVVEPEQPGNFTFKLPALPEDTYTIVTRISARGKTETVRFEPVKVQHSPSEAATENVPTWLRTALLLSAGTIFFALFGGLMLAAWRFAMRAEEEETAAPTSKEAVSV